MITLAKTLTQNRLNLPDITYKGGALHLSEKTYIMGILNRTPDSFSDGAEFMDEGRALRRIEEMAGDGADIIDIGGESTRPGSEEVSLGEEIKRVIPLIKKASHSINIPISVDTRKSEVAEAALEAGASIVNDITALRGDGRMRNVVGKYGAPVILMHMKGTPKTMQDDPQYDNLIEEIISYLHGSVEIAKDAGIAEEKIIIDPGIGFGKTAGQNLSIIKNLEKLKALKRPILIGTSRKSFIGTVLNLGVKDRLMGTVASVAVSIMNGASIVRVHDVRPVVEAVRILDAVLKAE